MATSPYVDGNDCLVWHSSDRTAGSNGGPAGSIRQGYLRDGGTGIAYPEEGPRHLDSQRKVINVAGMCGGNSPVIRHEMHVRHPVLVGGTGNVIHRMCTGTLRMDQREQYIERADVIHIEYFDHNI